jgi:hypothetical protein
MANYKDYKDYFNTTPTGSDEEFCEKVMASAKEEVISFSGTDIVGFTEVAAPRRRRFMWQPAAAAVVAFAVLAGGFLLFASGDDPTAHNSSNVFASGGEDSDSTGTPDIVMPPHDPDALLMQRMRICHDLTHPMSFVGDRMTAGAGTTVYRVMIGEEMQFGDFTLFLESISVGGHGGFGSWCEENGPVYHHSGTLQYHFTFPNDDGDEFRRTYWTIEHFNDPNGGLAGTITGPTDEFLAIRREFAVGFVARGETHLRPMFGSRADGGYSDFFGIELWTLDELVEHFCPPCAVDLTVPPVFEEGEECACRTENVQSFQPHEIEAFVIGDNVYPITWGGVAPVFPPLAHTNLERIGMGWAE